MARTAPPPPTAGDSSSEEDESSLASDSESSSDEDEPVAAAAPAKAGKVAPKAKAPKAKAKPPPSVVAGWTPSVAPAAPAEPPRALHHLIDKEKLVLELLTHKWTKISENSQSYWAAPTGLVYKSMKDIIHDYPYLKTHCAK